MPLALCRVHLRLADDVIRFLRYIMRSACSVKTIQAWNRLVIKGVPATAVSVSDNTNDAVQAFTIVGVHSC